MTQVLKAVALMGATGTGKSQLAMTLAAASGSCIVSCDSMQVYAGLDIGTAKPSPQEQQRLKHHLIDCCNLPDQYSAARWAAQAREVIATENARGVTPLIVGGTGLYLRALLEGFADIPAEKPEVREYLEGLQQEHGTPYLHQRLCVCDPAMAAKLKQTDTQRVMRALGVYESSGRPLSAWQADGERLAEPMDCPVFVLEVEREVLRHGLAERFQAMMAAGWMDEARWLDGLNLPDMHPASRAVGYRQLLDYLHGALSLNEAVEKGITATRKYAKRQVTWFKYQQPGAIFGRAEYLQSKLSEALI